LYAELDKKDEIKTALIAAKIHSFSLERMILDFKGSFKTRSDVYEFFRQNLNSLVLFFVILTRF